MLLPLNKLQTLKRKQLRGIFRSQPSNLWLTWVPTSSWRLTSPPCPETNSLNCVTGSNSTWLRKSKTSRGQTLPPFKNNQTAMMFKWLMRMRHWIIVGRTKPANSSILSPLRTQFNRARGRAISPCISCSSPTQRWYRARTKVFS